MIVEWFLDLVSTVIDWFFGLFDGLSVPTWIKSPPGYVHDFFGSFASLGAWVPWAVIGSVVALVLGVYGVGFVVKVVKQILAHVPAFGGAG